MDSWTHSFAPEYTMGPGLDFDRLPCSFGGNFFRRDLLKKFPTNHRAGTFTIEPLARIASAITFEGASKRERNLHFC